MNGDLEAFQESLLKLFQDLMPIASTQGSGAMPPQGREDQDASDPPTPPLRSPTFPASGSAPIPQSGQPQSLVELGDLSTVQDRFHALLKRRLQSEIQHNPPLFPWETEVHDYETAPSVYAFSETPAPVSSQPSTERLPVLIWLNQLKTLNLPVSVPEAVLTRLFHRCQDVLQSSLREGAQLVQAVDDLFPEQSEALNYLAGLVIAAPARSGSMTPIADSSSYPPSYDAAAPAQQMVLSLLAARDILHALTLTLSISQPVVERQWMTELGALTLRAEWVFTGESTALRVMGTLPAAGSLTLQGNELQAIAQRPTPGALIVELLEVQPGQPCVLEVQLSQAGNAPLRLSLQIMDEA